MTTTVISGSTLIDGTGSAPLQDPVVVVRDGKIAGVFQGKVPEGVVPAGATTLDYRGATLLPGLIDAHVHLNFPADGTSIEELAREPDGVVVAAGASSARRALDAGITTVRDTGSRLTTTFELRRALQLGYGRGPRIRACGQPITITGGHTWYLGGEADGEDQLRRKVRTMVKSGADAIKIMASGGGTLGTTSWLPSFSRGELTAIADEAHRMGRKVTAHCLCAEAIEFAVDAGVDQLEHAGFIVDDAGHQEFVPSIAEKVARAGVAVTSTLAVGGFVVKTMEARTQRTPEDQALLDQWRRMLDENLSHMRQLREAGVQLIAGTDAGWRFTPFDGLAEELALLHESGMPAMDALMAATSRSAEVMGIESELGTVQEGQVADIIAVHGDPLKDLRTLSNVRLVLQGGVPRVIDGHPAPYAAAG